MRTANTFEERFHELRHGWHWRVWRDIRCALFIVGLIVRNLTVGRRVRRKYRACKRDGTVFWLDAPPSARDDDKP